METGGRLEGLKWNKRLQLSSSKPGGARQAAACGVPPGQQPVQGRYRAVVFYTGPDAFLRPVHPHPHRTQARGGASGPCCSKNAGRAAPPGSRPNNHSLPWAQHQSWGCPASPVKVRWATPCHPPRHGSRPGVCFLSLISVRLRACDCVET